MADKIYPSAKPAGNGTANGGANPSFPATKAQLYGATRPTYRPQPHHRRSSRRCCCTFLFWFILLILVALLLIGLAGVAIYFFYRPHRPSFTVNSVKLSYLNITSSSTVHSKFDLNITAKNPNNKVVFFYKPTSISILSDEIDVGDGTLPSFEHGKKNSTLLKASVLSSGQALDSDAATQLTKNMKSKNGLPLTVILDTKVKAKMGALKTPNVGIRVSCEGIQVNLPTRKKLATASPLNAMCKVDVRVKIWKWTV